MNIDTLKSRIENAENKLVKSQGTLERHQKQLTKKAKILTDQGIDLNNYDRYEHRQTDTYWDICDYDSKLEDIKNTEKKIAETTKTLEELKEKLKIEESKEIEENNLVTEVLEQFLESWKQKAFNFYINLANKYMEVRDKDYSITKEELEKLTKKQNIKGKRFEYEEVQKYNNEEIENILKGIYPYLENERSIKRDIASAYMKSFKARHFASDLLIIDNILDYDIINEKKLNKILDEDVKAKKSMFIARIKDVVGDIIDLTALKIGDNGEINGIAIGNVCNAKVETITAGGWNIQCEHFRVLVNKVK